MISLEDLEISFYKNLKQKKISKKFKNYVTHILNENIIVKDSLIILLDILIRNDYMEIYTRNITDDFLNYMKLLGDLDYNVNQMQEFADDYIDSMCDIIIKKYIDIYIPRLVYDIIDYEVQTSNESIESIYESHKCTGSLLFHNRNSYTKNKIKLLKIISDFKNNPNIIYNDIIECKSMKDFSKFTNAIDNIINNKQSYIGASDNPNQRYNSHKYNGMLFKYMHVIGFCHGKELTKSMKIKLIKKYKKYGIIVNQGGGGEGIKNKLNFIYLLTN
jgi:hypothetical protein